MVQGAQPVVGEKAPDFTLPSVDGKRIRFSELTAGAPAVLVVLRGYPGYQCPFCNRQAQDFLGKAEAFAQSRTRVVLIYPGPPENLETRAAEFMNGKAMPENFTLLLDAGYEFANSYGLRWNAPRETAYPSTFVINRDGVVTMSKIAKSHGGRTNAVEILELLPKGPPR